MYPNMGGGGFINETTNEPEIKKMAISLLKKLKWHGVAQVEFKMDPRDNIPKLMEINPKFWGTTELSIASGINFPMLLSKLAVDGEINSKFDYQIGVKFIWISNGLFGHIFQSEKTLKTIMELKKFYKEGAKTDIDFKDLFPNILLLGKGFYKATIDELLKKWSNAL
jgi:hypothetical protein